MGVWKGVVPEGGRKYESAGGTRARYKLRGPLCCLASGP